MIRFAFCLLLCVSLPAALPAENNLNWQMDFADGKPGKWVGYGGDSVCRVVKDKTAQNFALCTEFSDKSSTAWAHRGVRIAFRKPIPRAAFRYVHFDYMINRPVKKIGYFLQDEDDNMWRVFTGPVVTGKWSRSMVRESMFKFGWGKKPPGRRSAKIVRLYLFVETPRVNTNTRFRLSIDNIGLSREAPRALGIQQISRNPVSRRERYLLLDPRVINKTENARLAIGTVKKHPANPLFGEDRPWERAIHHMYANVLFDKAERLYKIWYFTTIAGPPQQRDWGNLITAGPRAPEEKRQGNCATLYAVSKDGIRWQKPALDLYRYQGRRTNIVVWGTHGTGIFKDSHAGDPLRRYKRISGRHPHGALDAAFSSDGVHWQKRFPIARARGDTHNNALWVPELQKYVAFTRAYPPPGIRTVLRLESADFVRWSQPVEVLRGSQAAQTYSMPVFRYGGIYLGLPAIYHTAGALRGRVTTELAWSPDTKIWERIDAGQPLIPLSQKPQDVNWGCVYAAATPIFHRNNIRIYYSGQKQPHGWNKGWLCLATLRPDGWAGYRPRDPAKPAVVLSNPVPCNGKKLWITADVAAGGTAVVTLLDSAGRAAGTANVIKSSTEMVVLDVSRYQGTKVRVRIKLRNAQVYSFGFRNKAKRS